MPSKLENKNRHHSAGEFYVGSERRMKNGEATTKEKVCREWFRTRGNPDFAKLAAKHTNVQPKTIEKWCRNWSRGAGTLPAAMDEYKSDWKSIVAELEQRSSNVENRAHVNARREPVFANQVREVQYFFYNTDARALFDDPNPRYQVMLENGFAAAGGARKYGDRFEQLAPGDILLMYENGIGVVGLGTIQEHWDGISHKTTKYYTKSEMAKLDGGPNEYRVGVDWWKDLSDKPIGLSKMKKLFGNAPRGVVRRIVEKRALVEKLIEDLQPPFFPEEVGRPQTYPEGATRQVSVNAFERNRDAVRKCKELHGTTCVICKFNFGAAYGAAFDGFIHVHHLRPLSEIGGEYLVDPKKDLNPVCPNCHAVIHYGGKLRGIDEVRALLNGNPA